MMPDHNEDLDPFNVCGVRFPGDTIHRKRMSSRRLGWTLLGAAASFALIFLYVIFACLL